MRLLYSPTSPYARKVRAVVIEKGLIGSVRMVDTSPLTDPPDLHASNPLGKVPTLILDDGRAVFDSPVICDLLDRIGTGPLLVPVEPVTRLDVMLRQALADGVMDAAFNLVMERRRPPLQQSPEWSERWAAAILRSVAAMKPAAGTRAIDLGAIACGCALAYLDFRLPEIDWRSVNPALGSWHWHLMERPCFTETASA